MAQTEKRSAAVKTATKKAIRVAVIYHSDAGTTKRVAEHVHRGLEKVANVEADLLTHKEGIAKVRELVATYDAFVFGCPTYFGGVSAEFKSFLDKTSHIFYERGFQDKICAGFTNSASQAGDKQSTLYAMQVYAAQQGLIWVPYGIEPTNNTYVRNENSWNRTGANLGLVTQSYVGVPEGVSNPPIADLEASEFFGERLGNVFLRYYS